MDIRECRYGYIIKKKSLLPSKLTQIKKDLTLQPSFIQGYGFKPAPVVVYLETKSEIKLPKIYAEKEVLSGCKFTKFDFKLQNENCNLKFNGSLRDEQVNVTELVIEKLKKTGRALLVGRPGFGKTACGLYVVSRLKCKTLIVVHKEFLMEQWKSRIAQFIPSAKVDIIRGTVLPDGNSDITIGMLQSISMKDYDRRIFENYNTIIFDEVHHLGAFKFSQAFPKVSGRFTLGLSATPTRQDGLTSILDFNFGDFITTTNETIYNEKTIIKVLTNKTEYIERKIRFGGINFQDLISQLVTDKLRNEMIINEIEKLLKLKYSVLVLSDRREHTVFLNDTLNKSGVKSGLYIGGMKKSERSQSEECNVICGTYNMVSEGFDLPKLNALVMCCPKKMLYK